MATPASSYLQPDEEVVREERRHPLSIVDDVIVVATTWLVLCAATLLTFRLARLPHLASVGLPLVAAVTVLAAVVVLVRVWRMRTSRYTITSERVYKTFGRIRFFLLQTTYDKVTDLHVRQSLFGRIWGFGTVTVHTAGTGVALEGVRDPLSVKGDVEAMRRRFLHRLLAQHAGVEPDGKSPQDGPAPEEDGPLWQGGPVLAAFFGAFASGTAIAIFAMVALVGGVPSGELMWTALAAAMLLVGVSQWVMAWVRFRFTRYEVHAAGVVVTSGWLSRRRVETTYDKVTDVTVYQGLLGRLVGFGSITVNTAGGNDAPVMFHGLAHPHRVKGRIDEARRARRPARGEGR